MTVKTQLCLCNIQRGWHS